MGTDIAYSIQRALATTIWTPQLQHFSLHLTHPHSWHLLEFPSDGDILLHFFLMLQWGQCFPDTWLSGVRGLQEDLGWAAAHACQTEFPNTCLPREHGAAHVTCTDLCLVLHSCRISREGMFHVTITTEPWPAEIHEKLETTYISFHWKYFVFQVALPNWKLHPQSDFVKSLLSPPDSSSFFL